MSDVSKWKFIAIITALLVMNAVMLRMLVIADVEPSHIWDTTIVHDHVQEMCNDVGLVYNPKAEGFTIKEVCMEKH